MNKKDKIKLGSLVLMPLILAGCEKTENDLEVVDEFLMADDNEVLATDTLNKEEHKENKEDKKDKENKEENVSNIENTDKNSSDKVSNSSNNSNKNNDSNQSSTSNSNNKIEKVESDKNESVKNEESNKVNTSNSTILENAVLQTNPVFTKSEIPESIKEKMMGKSMTVDATISFDELSYLTISHLDYNGNTKLGEMVVNSKVADEVLDIFRDIYNAKFPIEKMKLVDEYGASDHKSMVANNSSAFCYRTIAGTNKVSKHGMGVAIDINPFYNPHVLKSKGTVNPPEASKYANRGLNELGMIKQNDPVYKAFTSRGWKWGGSWNNPDYQHFEKNI